MRVRGHVSGRSGGAYGGFVRFDLSYLSQPVLRLAIVCYLRLIGRNPGFPRIRLCLRSPDLGSQIAESLWPFSQKFPFGRDRFDNDCSPMAPVQFQTEKGPRTRDGAPSAGFQRRPQHLLYFLPDPQGHGSFTPILRPLGCVDCGAGCRDNILGSHCGAGGELHRRSINLRCICSSVWPCSLRPAS
jgi:hypothetical protein